MTVRLCEYGSHFGDRVEMTLCASASSRPIRAVIGAPGGAIHTADHSDDQLLDRSCKAANLTVMSEAVQFGSYGGADVFEVRDVPGPVPGAGEVLRHSRGTLVLRP
jgi:hypothetical protein